MGSNLLAYDEQEIIESIEKSKKLRETIEKNLPSRDIASIKQNEKDQILEYNSLMNENDDKNWFNEIDQVIADEQ